MKTVLVLILVPQLASPEFKTRELAHQRLKQLLPVVGADLVTLRDHPDAEVAARISHLYESWAWQAAENIRPTNWPYMPWIDSLPKTYPDRGLTIDAYLGSVTWPAPQHGGGSGQPEWPTYRVATKRFIANLLIQGKTAGEVRDVLDAMADYEKSWIKSHQHSYQFPKALLSACE